MESNAENFSELNFREKKKFSISCLFLALLTLAVFLPVIRYGFIGFDDPEYVTNNKIVQKGLSWEGLVWAFGAHVSNWHPLTWISHMLDCQIFGVSPAGHHFINLLFHIANTLLLFWLLTIGTGAMWRSALVAALFSVHPLHIESVAWISERKDVLSTFFMLLSLASYFRYAKPSGPTNIQRSAVTIRTKRASYYLSLLFCALGLMSKPMLVTLPFLFLLLDFWPLRRIQFPPLVISRQLVSEKIPFFALSLVSSLITFYAQKKGGSVSSLISLPFSSRLANALVSYCRYIWKMIWPIDLAIVYPLQEWTFWQSSLAAVFLVLITIVAVRVAARRPYFITGWLWFWGTLVPVIGLIQVGVQSMADRYSYVSLIGLFLCFVWGMNDLLVKTGKQFAVILAALAIAGCAFTSRVQLQYWWNAVTIFERALAVTKNNITAYTNLGVALGQEGRVTESIQQYRAALRINPNHGETHYNFANALARIGETSEAVSHYRAALKANPKDAQSHNNLATILQRTGEIHEAGSHYQEAIRLQFEYPEAHFNFALLLVQQKKYSDAIDQFDEVVQQQPENEQAHYQLANLLVGQRNLEAAISHLRAALQLRPDWPDALNFLARILATSEKKSFRNGEEALRFARQACELSEFKKFAYVDTLAAAFAENGNFAEAIQSARRAKGLAEKSNQTAVVEQIELHLKKFESGQPLREF